MLEKYNAQYNRFAAMLLYKQIKKLQSKEVKPLLKEFLREDMAAQDITSNTLISKTKQGEALLSSREKMIFCGAPIVENMFSKKVTTKMLCRDGDLIKKSQIIAKISGPMLKILTCERVLLNLVQRLSGISTLTSKYVQKLNSREIKVLDTRKTTPGLRLFEKYAVSTGGGNNHRLDLSSGMLIKDNHLTLIKEETLRSIQLKKIKKPIQIEVDHIGQITAENLKISNGYLLDNMGPAEIGRCIKKINSLKPNNKNIFIEASGGITLKTISQYNIKGLDGVSVGALTHQARSVDVGLDIK